MSVWPSRVHLTKFEGLRHFLTMYSCLSVRLYVDEDVFEVLQNTHISIGYGPRDGMMGGRRLQCRSSTEVLEFVSIRTGAKALSTIGTADVT
jgi:hypothetical protein